MRKGFTPVAADCQAAHAPLSISLRTIIVKLLQSNNHVRQTARMGRRARNINMLEIKLTAAKIENAMA